MGNFLVNTQIASIVALDARLRAALGDKLLGISSGFINHAPVLEVHLNDAYDNEAVRLVAAAIIAKHNTLVVSADKVTITADDTDTAVIACASDLFQSDTHVTVTVWRNGQEYTAATDIAVSAGAVGLELATQYAGDYIVEISRKGGNHDTGYITIRAD